MTFEEAFDRVLGHEGGYVFDAHDPGGETNWGISKRSYPHLDIKALTRDQARAIYLRDFWTVLQADKLPPPIAFQLFDLSVNSGIETATRLYQRALGVADDGYWGPVSKRAAQNVSVCDQLMQLNAQRLDYMTRLSGWTHFGRGWARRISRNLQVGAEEMP